MEETLYHLHFEQETSHWWFAARSKIVRYIIEKYGNLKPGDTILDVGCGTGAILSTLSETYNAVGIDMSPLAIEYSKKRGLRDVSVMRVQEFPHERYNVRAVLLLDVIEHIDDDLDVLRTVRDIVAPDGRVIITVPAYPWLWSAHDLANHHVRRYTARTLREALDRAGLEPVKMTYYNTFLFPLAVVKKMIDRRLTKEEASKGVDKPSTFVNSLFKRIFASERLFVGSIRFPYGVSLLTVARPKGAGR